MNAASARKSPATHLLEQAEKGRLAENATVALRVSGGAAGNRIDKSIRIAGGGDASVHLVDEIQKTRMDVRLELGSATVVDLLRAIRLGAGDLLRKQDAGFLPGSLVGSVSINVGSEVATYYFLADEEAYADVGRRMPAGVGRILGVFKAVEDECASRLQRGGESGP